MFIKKTRYRVNVDNLKAVSQFPRSVSSEEDIYVPPLVSIFIDVNRYPYTTDYLC